MRDEYCAKCSYFVQHYTFTGRKIVRVYCGHRTYSKVRRKKPDTPACENFVPGMPPEEAFVRKEYLSKELLHYMLSLELLSENGDERIVFEEL